jgi:putative ABC transport system permease protein
MVLLKKSSIEFMLAWRNVWKNKRRTILTLLTIMVGCAMIILFRAIQDGGYGKMIEDSIASNTGHIQIHEKGFWENMSIDYAFEPNDQLLHYLRKSPGVSATSIRVHAGGLIANENNSYLVMVQGVDPEQEKKVSNIDTTVQPGGRYITADDGKNIVMGYTLAKNLEVKVGDQVIMSSQGFDGSFAGAKLTIVGIFKTGNPRYDQFMIIMPLAQAKETFSMMGHISSITVRLKNTANMEDVRDEIRGLPGMKKSEVMGWDELLPELIQHIVMDKLFGNIFYFILLLIVSFGVLNTIQMSVFERIRELGIMMAIGTKPRQIVTMVMIESVFISLMGVLLGMAVGSALSYYFTLHPFDYSEYQKEMEAFNQITTVFPALLTIKNVLSTALVTFLFGVTFSIAPARRASKLKPLEAIRQL